MAVLPAVVLACVVLLQGSELHVPAVPKHCSVAAAQCAAKPLRQVGSERSSVLAYGWIGAGLLLALGIGVALRSEPSPGNRQAEDERAVLVRACIDVSDTVPSAALREQLVDALAEAGVTPVAVAAGEPFDSSRHRAVGQVGTSDRAQHNLVARTERAGYVDRGRRLRYPDVLVFNADGGSRS